MFRNPITRYRRLSRYRRLLKQSHSTQRGYRQWSRFTQWPSASPLIGPPEQSNPLQAFFEARKEGRGIWKWNHYFDIYDRHFSRFRGAEVHVLEIGIHSGGSLEMWRDYFGPRCQIYGLDLEPACRAYDGDRVKVFIGDQADRKFWQRFKQEVGALDIVIDDGGHKAEQQIVTLEELLPFLRLGGVFLCEDVQSTANSFASYVHGMANNLNAFEQSQSVPHNTDGRGVYKAKPFQSAVRSIHLYPFITVIERTDAPITELVSRKHGTEWEPALKGYGTTPRETIRRAVAPAREFMIQPGSRRF